MARSRNIKPGFFMNDELAQIHPLGRLLFIGLWTIADREGRLEDRPARIKAETLPYDDCDVDKLLNDLARYGFIIRYEVDGVRYIQVANFTKHQNPHIKEKASEIPPPPQHYAGTVRTPDKNGTSTGKAERKTELERDQGLSSSGMAGEIQTPYEHRTSTMHAPEMHQHDPADSLLLIPDSLKLKTDSLETDSGTNVSQSVGSPPADDLESVIQAYREHIGELGPAQLQVLKSWLEDQERNMAAEVVTEAIKIAAAMGKRRMSYVEGILRNWRNDGVESLEDIERLESANRRQRDDQRERRYDPEKYREILKEAGMLDEGAS